MRGSWSVFDEVRRSVFARFMEEYGRLLPPGSDEDAPSAFGVVDVAIAVVLQPEVLADQVGREERTIGVAKLRERRRSGPPLETVPAPPHPRGAYASTMRQVRTSPDAPHEPERGDGHPQPPLFETGPTYSIAATLVDRACDRVAAELQRDGEAFAKWQPRDELFRKELPRLEKGRAQLSARAFADPAWVDRLNRRNMRYALLRTMLDAALECDRPAVEAALALIGTDVGSLTATFDWLGLRWEYPDLD